MRDYYDQLKEAMENGYTVIAGVFTLDGQYRVRIGKVANLNHETVTIFDQGKFQREAPQVNTLGFRSTPLNMIQALDVRKRTSWVEKLWTAFQ